MILVDTDVMIDILRNYPPAIEWLHSLEDEEIILPGFVVMELIQGSQNKAEQKKVEKVLFGLHIYWPSAETCDEALSVFSRYRLTHGLGILDSLIGQMSVTANSVLCTFNQKHYEAIPRLRTVKPYKRK